MAEARVLELIQQQNKPFNLQNLVDLLAHAGFKKAQIQKSVDSLAADGKIVCKDFGKTKLYIPRQDNLQVLSKEELDATKAKVSTLKAEIQQETVAVKELEQELGNLKNSLTEEEIASQTQELTIKLQELEKKLSALRSGAVLISKEEREAVEKAFVANMEHWRKRRGIFKNIWAAISDGLEGKQENYYEEIGVETDDAVGVDFRQLEQLLPKKRRF